MQVLLRTAVVLVSTLVLSAPLHAQISTGTIAGTITDEQGGVLPGATVLLISETQ